MRYLVLKQQMGRKNREERRVKREEIKKVQKL